ncbi:MAG: DUF502 domain-containing protein [Alphaproteobacteria bacterium]|nr:DUF502 domain-containing protein [Alphaproteobacteria bacterium]
MNDRAPDSQPHPPRPSGVLHRLRNYFLTGVIVTAPILITVYLVWEFVTYIDALVDRILPPNWRIDHGLPFDLHGYGLIIALVVLTVIGMLTANIAGRWLVRLGERVVQRMPVVRSIYSALKQVFESLLSQSTQSFDQVVLIEYPRPRLWTLAFVTSRQRGEVHRVTGRDLLTVFVPTTPNPTSGFVLFVPREDAVVLDMKVDEALKYVISTGVVAPPDRGEGPTRLGTAA